MARARRASGCRRHGHRFGARYLARARRMRTARCAIFRDAAWRQLCALRYVEPRCDDSLGREARSASDGSARIADGGAVVAAGFAAPFGRLDAATLQRLAIARPPASALMNSALALALSLRCRHLRERPHRRSSTSPPEPASSSTWHDPLLPVDACPGSPGLSLDGSRYPRGSTAAGADPAAIGLPHVPTCRVAPRAAPAPSRPILSLVGVGDCFGVLRYDTARGSPRTFVPPASLSELPELLKTS